MKRVLLSFIFAILIMGTATALLTPEELDRLDSIDRGISRIETSTNSCQEISTLLNRADLTLFGTQYKPGESGKVFLQLLDSDDAAINDATCRVTAYYPNLTRFLDDEAMTLTPDSNGLYFRNIVAPTTIGVYMVEAECLFRTNSTDFNVSSFTVFNGTILGGDVTSIHQSDDIYLTLSEVGGDFFDIFNATEFGSYPMEQGSGDIIDVTGNLNDANLTGNVTYTTGFFGNGTEYDGVVDFATINGTAQEMFIENEEQIIACISYNTTTTTKFLFELATEHKNSFISLNLQAQGRARAVIKRGGTTATLQDSASTDDGDWHSACIFSDARLGFNWLYVDGVEVDSSGNNDADPFNITQITIGADKDLANDWVGRLDEFCMWTGFNLSSGVVGGQESQVIAEYETNRCNNTGVSDNQDILIANFTINNLSFPQDMQEIRIDTEYQWDTSAESIEMFLWNYNTTAFDKLDNDLTFSLTDTSVLNTIDSGFSQYLSANTSIIKIQDSNATEGFPDILKIDHLDYMAVFAVSTPVIEVRASQEIHVIEWFDDIAEDVWSFNGTINPNILVQIAQDVWNFTGTVGDFFANAIWNSPNRSLLVDDVWNATDRNLTFYEDTTDYELIQNMVWNATNRTLTDFNFTVNVTGTAAINLTDLQDAFECIIERELRKIDNNWGVKISEC